MDDYRDHLKKEITATMDKYNQQRKRYYDKNRIPPREYVNDECVYVDVSVGKVGNKAKLPINRKRAHIIDKIGDNAYVVRYDNGKIF